MRPCMYIKVKITSAHVAIQTRVDKFYQSRPRIQYCAILLQVEDYNYNRQPTWWMLTNVIWQETAFRNFYKNKWRKNHGWWADFFLIAHLPHTTRGILFIFTLQSIYTFFWLLKKFDNARKCALNVISQMYK